MKLAESSKLELIAAKSIYAEFNAETILYSFEVFSRYIVGGGNLLEMGPAEGLMTDHLVKIPGIEVSVVEGAITFCSQIQDRYPEVNVQNCLFENFIPDRKYDYIVMGHVLEHVENPVEIIKLAANWLTENGRILAAVPNSRSIHRQAAVLMGMLESEWQLNEMDMRHGHRRVYSPESFRHDFLQAQLKIEHFGGYWLKPVSNGQIETGWNSEMLRAFMQLGERYPDIAGEIYIVASKP